ncbi:metal ABC transporter ATP-binding protein [Citricoccus sp. NR2]|uniref:metal ABC transporter ATP-binding protein n=1 Tax=Citricoccus sp. NR2 TaxID=3004095 RepID=UPI0022DD2001|nr:ABC transporter ATP-binding protein [Citricoccus sp. NR2]WBL18657.1 ABC transporter ATP-binding protein [Citricoccus sp. NR2]
MSTQHLVQAEDIVLMHGSHLALDSSSFTLPAGGVTAVIGPNGSGKSTLLQAIAGILEPSAGRIQVLGASVEQMRPRISYVMQSVVYPVGTPLTVRDVVRMGRFSTRGWFKPFGADDRKAVKDAMVLMNIEDLAHRHLEELSGGQRQRVYVAQGVAQGHEILMLDEPMTGLDIVSKRIIDDVVHTETEHGHSVVLTTHDLDEAAAADHVLLLNGSVVASGPPEQVLTREHLETVYGLGALHSPASALVDPPHENC